MALVTRVLLYYPQIFSDLSDENLKSGRQQVSCDIYLDRKNILNMCVCVIIQDQKTRLAVLEDF